MTQDFNPYSHNQARSLIEQDKAHVWHHLVHHQSFADKDPLMLTHGQGMYVWDIHGNRYLDAISGGVWTVNVGYGREQIANAIRDQLIKLPYYAQAVGNVPATEYASALLAKMPGLNRVYYSSSGSEANEKAFKMVRQIAHRHYGGKKHKILYRDRDYHGTTITCLSATGHAERKAQYGPYTPGFVEVPHCLAYHAAQGEEPDFGEIAAAQIEQVILDEGPETIGALCLEPITAGGGLIVPPAGYWERVQAICHKYDILLHLDEVVCGLGRTGQWFGYQHYGIKPDIVTLAKGVASGYAAIACTVTTEAVFEALHGDETLDYFRDISTYGGCTAGPVAALANLRIIEDELLLENVADNGPYLLQQLEALKAKHEVIGEVRGLGYFAGIELVTDRVSKTPLPEADVIAVVNRAMQRGVIIGKMNRSLPQMNNVLTLCPALIATRSELDEIVSAIDHALSSA